jgi:MATE family multidrug resistance protein
MSVATDFRTETRKLAKLGAPIVGTQLLGMGLNLTDTIMAGNLSALDLAGVAIGNSLYMPIVVFCFAVMHAITPIVGEHLGARRFFEIGKSARQLFWLVLMLAIPAFFLLRNISLVMEAIGVTEEIIPIADGYLKAISWGVLFILLFAGFRNFSEGLGVARPAMYITGSSIIINIGANYVLMYGKFGFPALGAVGTGYASSIVHFYVAVMLFFFLRGFKPFRRFNIFARTRGPEWKYIKEIVNVGLPNGISTVLEVLLFASVSLLMGKLSTQAAASHQIAINVAATMFMIPMGLSMAISQRVGYSIGQGSMPLARYRGFHGITIGTLCMMFTALILLSFPTLIVSIYTQDETVRQVAASLLFMAAIFQISDGLQVGAFGALRGLKDTRIPMIFNLVAYWFVGFPIGYYLGMQTDMGPKGLWAGLIAGLSVAAVLHNYRFHRLTRQKSEQSVNSNVSGKHYIENELHSK